MSDRLGNELTAAKTFYCEAKPIRNATQTALGPTDDDESAASQILNTPEKEVSGVLFGK